jgi:subtilisin
MFDRITSRCRRITSLLFLLALVVAGLPSPAAEAGLGEAGKRESSKSVESDDLTRKAERDGFVRVIVALRSEFVPEGRLSRAAVSAQRADIDRAQASLRDDLSGTDYRVLREFEFVPATALALSPRALEAASRSQHVETLTLDRPLEPVLGESVPIVGGTTMWNAGHTGSGKVVAVLDTGVDKAHLFLTGKVVEEACYSDGSDCPNGGTSQTEPGAGVPCTYAASGCKHGTHVAGIAAGKGNTFSGVARDASVMSVQVFSMFTGPICGGGEDPCALSFTSDQMAGLERVYAVRGSHDFASVNMSLGGGQFFTNCDSGNEAYKAVIDNLRTAGIATVIASGNNGFTDSMAFPACISSAVSVGSTTKNDEISSFSNSASFLSLLAPGSAINSSVPGGSFESFNGTSMAAPHVAGAWALMEQANPGASVSSILTALQNTGVPVTDDRSGGTQTKPRICIAAAAGLTNDDFADSDAIPDSTAPLAGSNGCATKEAGEPDHAGIVGGKSVWYDWTAPASGQVTIDTAGSNFDTLLGVYTGGTVNALTEIASNDDDPGGGFTSKVTFNGTSGTTYRIAVDGFLADMGAITLNLAGPPSTNQPPNAVNDTLTTAEDTSNSVNVLTNDTDPDGDTLSVTGSTHGSNGTVSCEQSGSCTYTPDAAFTGSDSFTYTADDDNGGTDVGTVNVMVIAVNNPPNAVDDSLTTDEDVANDVDVLDNDTDADADTLSVTGSTQGAHGTVSCATNGVCTYTPDANFHGIDSFAYTVNDGNGGTDVGSVNVTIDSVADDVARAVTLNLKRHLKARGKVTATPSDFDDCTDDVSVKIQRKKGGKWKTVKSATTNSNGAFNARLADKPGTYRALAPTVTAGDDNCGKDTSPAKRHRHRR